MLRLDCGRLPAAAVSVGTITRKRTAYTQRLSLAKELSGDADACNVSRSPRCVAVTTVSQQRYSCAGEQTVPMRPTCSLFLLWPSATLLTVTARLNQRVLCSLPAVLTPHQLPTTWRCGWCTPAMDVQCLISRALTPFAPNVSLFHSFRGTYVTGRHDVTPVKSFSSVTKRYPPLLKTASPPPIL